MVISADGAPTVAEPNAEGRAGSGSERRTWWVIRRGLLASAVGLALTLWSAPRARGGAGTTP